MNKIEFFLPIIPPTKTHQQKRARVVNGKPMFYEDQALADVRNKLGAYLSKHVPDEPFLGPLQLITKWCYPMGKHAKGYKTTKPDTDNMIKMLKDVMTKLGFWQDDAQVASEITEKFWAEPCGIYVCIQELEETNE